jgi:hypothetical protein
LQQCTKQGERCCNSTCRSKWQQQARRMHAAAHSSPFSRNARSCFELLRALSQNLDAFPVAPLVAAASAARASPVRVRTVQCRAIAAPAKEAHAPAQGPIILNGQVLHSSTEKQLEIVRDLGSSGYLQKQVRPGEQRQQQRRVLQPHVLQVLTQQLHVPAGPAPAEDGHTGVAAVRLPASLE